MRCASQQARVGRRRWLVASALAGGCAGYPTLEERFDDEVVATVYDQGADYASFATYALDPAVEVVAVDDDGNVERSQLERAAADVILARLHWHMTARGFVPVAPSEAPELGLTVTGLQGQVSGVIGGAGTWGTYGGTWGYPGWPYYYPFPVTYTYERGALLTELVDLRAARDVDPPEAAAMRPSAIPVVWAALGYRVMGAAPAAESLERAIDQAFEQSPYVRR